MKTKSIAARYVLGLPTDHRARCLLCLVTALIIIGRVPLHAAPRQQDAGPAQQAASNQDPAKEKEEEEKQEASTTSSRPAFGVQIGVIGHSIAGNDEKFNYYATPPTGLFLQELRWGPLYDRLGLQGLFSLRSPFEKDYLHSGRLSLFHGTTMLEGFLSHYTFHHAAITPVLSSDREITDGTFTQQIMPGFSISANYRMEEQNHRFAVPKLPVYQRARYWDVLAQGRLGPGQLSLIYSDWRYYDRTTIRPNTYFTRMHAGYLWEVLPALSLEAAFTRLNISQANAPKSRMETLQASADWSAAANTDLAGYLRRDKVSTPVTTNAHVTARRAGGATFRQRFPGWQAQVGVHVREADRVRGDLSYLDVPRWLTYEGRLSGRVGSGLRISVRGANDRLDRSPVMVSVDNRLLYWRNRSMAQIRMEGGSPEVSSYLYAGWRRWDNPDRGVKIQLRNVTAGATWQVDSRLGTFAEISHEAWTSKSEITEIPRLDSFSPNSLALNLGLQWLIDSNTSFFLTYAEYRSKNDNFLELPDGNTNGRYLTIGARHRMANGNSVGVAISPIRYRDGAASQLNYTNTLFMADISAKF